MFVLGTLGLGVLYLLSSLMFVLAVGSLYGATAALWTSTACAALGVFAGVMIGALLAGGFKHPLQSQLEAVVHEAASRRRGGPRYAARGESPYAREKDAPTYGDEGVPVPAGAPHDQASSWRPQSLTDPPAATIPYEAPSFQVAATSTPRPAATSAPSLAGGAPGSIQGTRSGIRKARNLRDQVPVAQMQQRLQSGDVEGAVELGRQAVEATYLDEVYEALPSLLATYRSGGGRAMLGQLAERTREATAQASGQAKADGELLSGFLDRLQAASPSDVSPREWMRILGAVGQARSNPRAFIQVVSEALQPEA